MRIRIITESLYLIFQIPILLLAPENENCFGPKHLTKWAGCWLYHFPIDSNLLDHQYPVVLAYNGINHYVSTYILDQKSKNSAILNLVKTMTTNISQVTEGLAGRGATNIQMFFNQLQVEINNAITSGDLTKFTPAVTSGPGTPGSSSQPPSSQAHPPSEKDTSVINVINHLQGAMSFKTTKCLNMDQVLAATCVIMSLFNLLLH